MPIGDKVGRLAAIFPTGGVPSPRIQSILTSKVSKNQQGELRVSISSLNGLATIIAPPLLTMSFTYFTSEEVTIYFPGAPYVIAAFCLFLGLMLFTGQW